MNFHLLVWVKLYNEHCIVIQPSKLTFFLSGHLATEYFFLVASEKF